MDASDFGRFGTLYLLKRHDPDAIIAPYPIDEPEITLGRDSSCSIRLYYAEVSAVHCKVVFNDEAKAFVVVLGTNGLLIDDCPVYPAPAGSAPTTVPLPNNSVLEVHKKRFRFAYPPKHLRGALAAIPPTPVASPGTRRRALRMSMITSAQVFSPRPFADPKRNLQVLQSPLKAVFKPEPDSDSEEEDQEQEAQQEAEEIVLVESDHPQVVESEKDLVILDHVMVTEPDVPPPSPYRSPARASQMPVPPQNWAPPRTPARRLPRASLHRAVLIRSAQRAALRHEMQREEERDAEEVESIMGDDAGTGMEDVEEEYEEEVKQEEEQQRRRTPMSGWRKSLEAVKGGLGWAFRAASTEPEVEPAEDTPDAVPQTADDDNDEDMDDQHHDQYDDEEQQDLMNLDEAEHIENIYPNLQKELQQPLPSTPTAPSAPLRPLGRFMTPQASSAFPRPSAHGRASLGGPALPLASSVSGASAGPRRVRLVEPWKISDIVVPPAQGDVKPEADAAAVKEERATSVVPGLGTPRRERVSEEEKRAIRERRKSALTTPDTFFNGCAPGLRAAASSSSSSAPLPALFPAPVSPQKDPGAGGVKGEDGEEDPGVLLARMREMVAGVRRRQSSGAEDAHRRASLSPRKRAGFSLLARDDSNEDTIVEEQEQEQEDETVAVPVAAAPREMRTPQMGDLRHLFGAPPPAATPQLTGVRDMFRPVRAPGGVEDAALEGVGEMLSSPAGWRGKAVAQTHGEDEEEGEMEEAPASRPRNKLTASRHTPSNAPSRGKASVSGLAAVEEDEVAAPAMTRPPAARVARRTKPRTVESDQEPAETSIPRTVRTRKTRTEEEDEVPELPTRTKASTRKKTGVASDVSEDEAGAASSRPLRRSTRAASSEPETTRKTPASTTTSARRARVTKTPASQDSASSVPKPSTARRGTRSKAVEAAQADETDPLDSFAPEAPAPSAAKVQRTARSRIPVGAVKEEDTAPATVPPSDDEHVAPARAVRGRKAAVGSRAPASSTATKSGTRTRAGTSTKKAASEAAGSGKSTPTTGEEEDGHAGDKENTPEPEDVPPVAPVTKSKARAAPASGSKVKATRSVAKTRGEVAEPAPPSADAPAKGVQRVSRKRTTTAGRA